MIVMIAVIIDTRVAATHHHHHVVEIVNGAETANEIVVVGIDPKSHVTQIDQDRDAGIDRNGFLINFLSSNQKPPKLKENVV